MPGLPLRVGTRGSPLALVQTRAFLEQIMAVCPVLRGLDAFREYAIATTGDAIQNRPLSEIGGKGLFAREIHEALLDGRIDSTKIEALARGVDGMKGGVTQQMSMHLGPNDVLLAIKVAFDRDLTVSEVERAIDTLEAQIRTALPHMRYIFVEPDAKYAMEKDPQRASMVGAER